MIVGVTGSYAAGKTEVCKYLESKGFTTYSLSDVIREEAASRGLDIERDTMIRLANELRRDEGPEVLAKRTRKKIDERKEEDFAIDSIRSPLEVEELRRLDDFILVGVKAPIETRFERLKERGRPGDPETLEELKESEAKENIKSDTNQQLDATFAEANVVIENNGSLEELHDKIDEIVGGA